jgi:hypothetical protein
VGFCSALPRAQSARSVFVAFQDAWHSRRAAVAQANEVKVELDRISQILNDVKGNTEATKNNTELIQGLIASSRKEIIITLILGIAAIIIATVIH